MVVSDNADDAPKSYSFVKGFKIIANKFKDTLKYKNAAKPTPEDHLDDIVESNADAVRRDGCLCTNCEEQYSIRLDPQTGAKIYYANCPAAKAGFQLCQRFDNAYAMTRCNVTVADSKKFMNKTYYDEHKVTEEDTRTRLFAPIKGFVEDHPA